MRGYDRGESIVSTPETTGAREQCEYTSHCPPIFFSFEHRVTLWCGERSADRRRKQMAK